MRAKLGNQKAVSDKDPLESGVESKVDVQEAGMVNHPCSGDSPLREWVPGMRSDYIESGGDES